MFLGLLETTSNKDDVIIHYIEAYRLSDKRKALKIIQRYGNVVNKESETYTALQDIKRELQGI